MTMLPITGGAYKHASQDVNCQRCVNWFPTEIGPEGLGIDDPNNAPNMEGISKGALIRSPGNQLLIDLGGQQCRGLFTINNQYVYAVVDNKLYQLVVNDIAGTATSTFIGTLNTSTGPVHMRNNTTQLLIVDGSTSGYVYSQNTFGSATIGPIGGSLTNPTYVAAAQQVHTTDFVLAAGAANIGTYGAPLIFTTTEDDSAITVTISGSGYGGVSIVEHLVLPNHSTKSTVNSFASVVAIATSGDINSNISVGAYASYYLSLNGTVIYNAVNAVTPITDIVLEAAINTYTNVTNITASSGGSGIVNLQNKGPGTITILEGGFGWNAGVDGLTVAGGDFSGGSVTAFQVITKSANGYFGGSTVIYNDGYFLYNQTGTNYIWQSQPNSGTQWGGLAYFTATTKPCIVQGLAVNKGEVWVFGDTLTEVHYDAANSPPASAYSYRVGSGMDVGCIAPHSIVELELINMWLDSRGFIAMSDISPYIRNNNSGYDLRVCSTPALHAEWATYPTLSDAIATYFVDRGHIMYMITFPSAQKTWVYDFPARPMRMSMQLGEWHERTYLNPTTSQEEYYLIQYVTKFNQMNIGAGLRGGKIYNFSYKFDTDNGAPIRCTRTTAPFTSDFKYAGIDTLYLRMETGRALQTGDGSNPSVMLRYSNDGAHTWSQSIARSMGGVGEYNTQLTWNRLGSAREWVFEFTVQSPVPVSLIKASVDFNNIEGGGSVNNVK